MLNAVRSSAAAVVFSSPSSKLLANKNIGRRVRFVQAMSGANQPQSTEKIDQSQEAKDQRGETIASFGEGYSTRSDEEGFGGVYGGNQCLSKRDQDKIVNANVPEYDESQGSEVKEKEKARNQNEVSS